MNYWVTILYACFGALILQSTNSFAQFPCPPFDGPQDGCHGCCKGLPYNPNRTGWKIPVVRPTDPNEIEGPKGYDTAQWVSVNDRIQYIVRYENDPKLATAPAQDVFLHVPVHEGINGNTLRLGSFGFGPYIFTIPPNTNSYSTRLDLRDSLGLYVDVTAGFDVTTNEVFWTLRSIDPLTGLPPFDPMNGFLPVNDTVLQAAADTIPGKGEGYVIFTLLPRKTLLTGDTVSEQASIVFNINEPIPTNVWTNTIDAFPPVSHMDGATVAHDTIYLHWSGQDDPGGTGIKEVTIYVSENNGPFAIYKTQVNAAHDYFVGNVGSQYRFFTLAADHVNNKEALKNTGEVTATITTVNLPVTWLYFTGVQKGNDAHLSWGTASEINCRSYVLERSLDAKVFSEIGVLQAKGSIQSNNYNFIDPDIHNLNVVKVYYRLRQVMADNTFTYSKTVMLPIGKVNETPVVKAYPNPFSGTINLQIINVTTTSQSDKVRLYSMDGKLRYQQSLSLKGTETVLLNDLPPLDPGIYILHVIINKELFTLKMVKK